MFGRKGSGGGNKGRDLSAEPTPISDTQATLAQAARLATEPPAETDRLFVGPGLTFNGAIATCDHLVVGGRVVSNIEQCRQLEIAASGSVEGCMTVTDADIAGQYDGELKVLGSLHIRATGHVKGRITYGSLAIEHGGHLLGIIDSIAEARPQTNAVVVPLRPRQPAAEKDRNG